MPQQPTTPQSGNHKVSVAGRFFLLRWRLQRFWATCGCLFHAVVFALKWAIILLALVVVWLSVWGLPRPWLNRAVAELGQHGIWLRVGQARLDIFHGLAFEDVALFETPQAANPILSAEKIRVFLNPHDWQRGEHGIHSCTIENGTLHLELGYPHLPWLSISNIHAHLRLEGSELQLANGVCDALGVQWQGHGVVRDAFGGAAVSREKLDLPKALAPLRQHEPAWLPPVLEFRQAVLMPATPKLDIDFVVQRAAPAANMVHALLRGEGTEFHNVHFSQWQVEGSSTGAVIHASATLQQAQKRLAARGGINLDEPQQTWANVFCDLPVNQVLNLLPSAWQQAWTNSGVLVQGSASVDVNLGPAPLNQLLERITGTCRAKNLVAAAVPVPSLRFEFQLENGDLTLSNLTAEVGLAQQQGRLEGRFALQGSTRRFQVQAHTTFDPHALFPIMGQGLSNVIALIHFDEHLPVADLGATGMLSDSKQLVVTGRVSAADFTFRDERVVLAKSAFRLAHNVLDLPDAQVVREDGYVQGHATYDIDNEMLDVDATGAAPPPPVAHMISAGLERTIRRFTFAGPVRVAVKGRVSVGSTSQHTDLRLTAEGERLGWNRLLAERANFDLRVIGPRLTFTNVHGVFCGGEFHGAADFSNVADASNCHYTASLAITNASFASICETLRSPAVDGTTTSNSMSGELTGQVAWSGRLDPWQSMEGSGEVYIHNGSIFQIKLFGGLSTLLGKIYTGLGSLSQTEFQMPFTISTGQIHSDDINIKGNVISLKGHGDYRFTNELNFNAQVQLLRNGTIADVLRIVTYPVTKLLEFKLIGTLEDPKWRPVNLPKELFLQFD